MSSCERVKKRQKEEDEIHELKDEKQETLEEQSEGVGTIEAL
jgi:hypothetical protein